MRKVSFETAKLAAEKGYDEDCDSCLLYTSWFEKLKKLEEYANLPIQDVNHEVHIRKKTFERIRAQHKACLLYTSRCV